ncbi:MAG TPA: Maf family nucleotide pyrophosphatase [Chitinophagales bacterium]|nr:Maf family nucleotide pyrophosphatase [Chitinophagales bacterium]
MKSVRKEKLILGSGSPRRKEILELADIDFDVLVSDVDESYPTDTMVREIPVLLAERKAAAIQKQFSVGERPILTADTVVVVEGEVLGKPVSREEAIQMIQKLSGRKHQVISGVCWMRNDIVKTVTDITYVTFTEIAIEDIIYYVDHYQPFDKAGAYAIQEWIGVRYIANIQGCYYNVMGLPLPCMLQELAEVF